MTSNMVKYRQKINKYWGFQPKITPCNRQPASSIFDEAGCLVHLLQNQKHNNGTHYGRRRLWTIQQLANHVVPNDSGIRGERKHCELTQERDFESIQQTNWPAKRIASIERTIGNTRSNKFNFKKPSRPGTCTGTRPGTRSLTWQLKESSYSDGPIYRLG